MGNKKVFLTAILIAVAIHLPVVFFTLNMMGENPLKLGMTLLPFLWIAAQSLTTPGEKVVAFNTPWWLIVGGPLALFVMGLIGLIMYWIAHNGNLAVITNQIFPNLLSSLLGMSGVSVSAGTVGLLTWFACFRPLTNRATRAHDGEYVQLPIVLLDVEK